MTNPNAFCSVSGEDVGWIADEGESGNDVFLFEVFVGCRWLDSMSQYHHLSLNSIFTCFYWLNTVQIHYDLCFAWIPKWITKKRRVSNRIQTDIEQRKIKHQASFWVKRYVIREDRLLDCCAELCSILWSSTVCFRLWDSCSLHTITLNNDIHKFTLLICFVI